MEKQVLDKYLKAGRIACQAVKLAKKMCKPGVKILDIAEKTEAFIRKSGAEPAFPVNISINEVAAHYTPAYQDATEISERDLVKIDVGTHVDGYIGDTALTYCSKPSDLIKCSEGVLKEAEKILKPGVTVSQIGEAIQSFVESQKLGVIVNLTGHGLGRFIFHGQPSIPNIRNDSNRSLLENDVIAIEPFITETNGYIKESSITEIYRFLQERPVRLQEAREILKLAREEYRELPFARRWLAKRFSPVKVAMSIRQLEPVMALESYPVLKEISGKPIAQSEHTYIIKDKPIVTTRISD